MFVLGVTAQVLFKHGYESGLQLVVRRLTCSGVLQGLPSPHACRSKGSSAKNCVANCAVIGYAPNVSDSNAADFLSVIDKRNCSL